MVALSHGGFHSLSLTVVKYDETLAPMLPLSCVSRMFSVRMQTVSFHWKS